MPIVVAALAGLIAIFAFGVAGFVSLHIARRSAAPFWPTPARAIRAALREADLKPGEVFYDLGAGNGKTLLIAEREFGARATGFEISLLPYLAARVNLLLRGGSGGRGAAPKMIFKNLFSQNLADADVVFCFLAERTMPRIAEKFRRELRPGARVIAYTFPLPDREPSKIIPVRGAWKMFIYRNAGN